MKRAGEQKPPNPRSQCVLAVLFRVSGRGGSRAVRAPSVVRVDIRSIMERSFRIEARRSWAAGGVTVETGSR